MVDDSGTLSDTTLGRDYSQEPRQAGYVKWFDEEKGYGFIARENSSDVFVHFSSINREPPTLKKYDRVDFVVIPGKKGPEARDVNITVEALE